MKCPKCGSDNTIKKYGKAASGAIRFKCKECNKHFNENTSLGLNRKYDGRDQTQTREYEENGTNARITQLTDKRVKTLQDLIDVCEIDTDK